MDYRQLLEYVVRPVLKDAGWHSVAAEQQLMGTCAAESGGVFITQLDNGPARGLFQMEPNTHFDIYNNYLRFRDDRFEIAASYLSSDEKSQLVYGVVCTNSNNDDKKLKSACSEIEDGALIYNLAYQAIMCRIHYLRVPDALPPAGDIDAMARYWKEHYNTGKGKGDEEHFISNFPGYLWGL
ncbi:TPA: hypothetical protein JG819_004686 [Vibrio parahaemolyticus]|nr:hypothetical protein [Vibrio parahaemolyticus]HAV1545586.1 hypothetical protein [Vibrio parahaemolyticus]